MIEWSRKQASIYGMADSHWHTMAVHGPVRSGKTMAAVHGFARFASTRFAGHDFIIASKSQRQLSAALIGYMREFAREHKVAFRRNDDHFLMRSFLGGSPNRFYPIIGSNAASADRASAFTAAGALLDEAHAMPLDFINVCRERVTSVPGGKFIAIANPEGPLHPYKTELIDTADGDGHHELGFELADNETLSEREVDLLHRIYPPGPLRERRIFGKWVAVEGMVYPFFMDAVRPVPKGEAAYRYSISIDHAESGITHAIRFAWYPSGIWADREWRHDGNADGRLKNVTQCQRIYRKLAQGRNIADWYCDPAAMQFQVDLANLTGQKIRPAENDVAMGIELTSQWMASGAVYISPECGELINEMHGYNWDPKAALMGEDRPIKAKDHGCDAFRYFCFTTAGRAAMAAKRPRIRRG